MKLANKIIYKLMSFVESNAYDIILPNFCYKSAEADVFKMNERGYITEYEVKISRSDFFADFKKGKHEIMKKGESICNRFYFVVPEGLVKKEEIPEYAGLIYFNEKGNWFNTIKNARIIHKNTVMNISELKFMLKKVTFRETIWRHKVRRLEYDKKEILKKLNKQN